jgi:maltooligosyltrehalose trehalohydrolase
MDAQWSDDFHHALHGVLTGERSGYYTDFGDLGHLATAITRSFVYGGEHSTYRLRPHGRSPRDVPGWRFVVAAQNHDQIGNRAQGDRLTHLVSTEQLKIAAALLLTAPFVPMLFQGEEWGASTPFQYFTSHEDPVLADQVKEGRRREFTAFGWKPEEVPNPQAMETFLRCQLRWDELSLEPHAGLLAWYRALIQLRQQMPELRDGSYDDCRVAFDERSRWMTIRRGDVMIVCNFSRDEPQVLSLQAPARVLLASNAEVCLSADSCHLPIQTVAILRLD